GQTVVNGDAFAEAHQLHRDLALVVIHGQYAIVAAAIGFVDGAHEGGVGGERTFGRVAALGGQLYAGADDFDLIAAEGAAIAVVRVQAADGNARLFYAGGFQSFPEHGDALGHAFGGQEAADVFVGNVRGDA